MTFGNVESRTLEVRCGLKTKDQTRKVYVHMLNGTLCATERALCCIVENYQTPDVSRKPLQRFIFRMLTPCRALSSPRFSGHTCRVASSFPG